MTEEESEEKERESQEEKRKKMREKIKKMQERGGPSGMPGGGGLASMMQRMASAGPQGGQQNRAMLEAMKGLKKDMGEIKEYLSKILDTLESK